MTKLTLDETIKKMMLNYPGQYQTRMDALRKIFNASYEWEHGDGVTMTPDAVERHGGRAPGKPYDEDKQVLEDRCKTPADEARARLFARRYAAKEQFVLDNADLLAIEEGSRFSSNPVFGITNANRLPLKTMDPIWLAALKEFCHAIIVYDERNLIPLTYKYTAEYHARYMSELTEAKKTATEVLARLAPVENPDKARSEQIAALRRQAAALGMALVEGTPDTLANVY